MSEETQGGGIMGGTPEVSQVWPKLNPQLSEWEQQALCSNPMALLTLADWHDYQQAQADACWDTGPGDPGRPTGNEVRAAQLRAEARRICEEDPELWTQLVLEKAGVQVPPSTAAQTVAEAVHTVKKAYPEERQKLLDLLKGVLDRDTHGDALTAEMVMQMSRLIKFLEQP